MQRESIVSFMRQFRCEPVDDGSDWVSGKCPFARFDPAHKDGLDLGRHFGVQVASTPQYKCFVCGRRGRLEWLPEHLIRFRPDDREALLALAADMASDTDMALFDELGELPECTLDGPQALDQSVHEMIFPDAWSVTRARDYLAARGIGEAAASRMRLRWLAEKGRIGFPVCDPDGSFWGYACRAVYETKVKVWNMDVLKTSLHLMGAEGWTGDRPLILVEGLFAYGRQVETGVVDHYDVAAVMGANLSKEQAAIIAARTCRDVILIFDDDTAGERGIFGINGRGGAKRLLESLGCRVSVPAYPKGKNDPDQLTAAEVGTMCTVDDPLMALFE